MSLAAFRARALSYVFYFRHERRRPELRWRPDIPTLMGLLRIPDAERRQQEVIETLGWVRSEALAELARDWPAVADPAVPLDAVIHAVRGLVTLATTGPAPPAPGGISDDSAFLAAEQRCFVAMSRLPDAAAAFAVRSLLEVASRVLALPESLRDASAFGAREVAVQRCCLADELSVGRDLARAAGLGGVLSFAEWDRLLAQLDTQLRRLLPLRYGDRQLAKSHRTAREQCRRVEGILRRLQRARTVEKPAAGTRLEGEAIRRVRAGLAAADVERLRQQLVNQHRETRSWTLTAYDHTVRELFQHAAGRPGGEPPPAADSAQFQPIAAALTSVGQLFRDAGLGALWERVDEGATFRLDAKSYSDPLEAAACHPWAAQLVDRALNRELTEGDIRLTWEEWRLRDSLNMVGKLLRGLAGEKALAYCTTAATPKSSSSRASATTSPEDSNGELDDEIDNEILEAVTELRGQDPGMKITQEKIANRIVCSPRSVKGRTPTLLREGKLIRTRRLGFSLPDLPGAHSDGA
jgi:hypothetical protein